MRIPAFRHVLRAMGVVAGVFVLLRCTPPVAVAPHDIAFGAGVYLDRTLFDSVRRTAIMDSAQDAGVQWSREEFHWDQIEPERGVQDDAMLARYDAGVDGLCARGIHILGLLAYRTPWSSGETAPDTEEERRDYADFAASMAERYHGRVDHWEIWNEPNIERFWPPKPDAKAYAALVAAASTAIRGVNPDAMVFVGAVSGTDYGFIEQVVDDAGPDVIDGISFHPYSGDTPWDCSDEPSDLNRLRYNLEQRGLGLPLWVTEIGYPSCDVGNGVEEHTQAALLVRAYLGLFSQGVENVFVYDFVDDGTDPDETEMHFGLLRHDLHKKPSWTAFQWMTQALSGSAFVEHCNDGSAMLLRFEKPDGSIVLVAWDTCIDVRDRILEASRGTVVSFPASGAAFAHDLYGECIELEQNGTEFSIEIDGTPAYVIQKPES